MSATGYTSGDPSKLDKAGGVVSGDLSVGSSTASRALNVISGYVPDSGQDDASGIDYTGRINLYSYQRASFHSFGEVLRIYSRKWDSKQMIAWYGPTSYTPYSPVTDTGGDPVGSDKPWFWMGAHYEANDHGSVHGHWSCEVPDSNGALQTRFEFKIWDPITGAYGMDKTNILTNAADFTVRCTNSQVLRLSANSAHHKDVQFNLDHDGSDAFQRWRLRCTSSAADLQILRYNDSGVLVDQPLTINRSTGQVQIGGGSGTSAGLTVIRNGGSALQVLPVAAAGTAINISTADTSSRALQADVSGDAQRRYVLMSDGRQEWGSGSATRDVSLYRSSAGTLRTDETLHVGTNLRLNTTSLGGGGGVIAIANATTVPSANPTGGGVLYVEAGALKYRGSAGTVTTLGVA